MSWLEINPQFHAVGATESIVAIDVVGSSLNCRIVGVESLGYVLIIEQVVDVARKHGIQTTHLETVAGVEVNSAGCRDFPWVENLNFVIKLQCATAQRVVSIVVAIIRKATSA